MKRILRREMLLKRGALETRFVAEKSAAIVKRLLALPEWKEARTVMVYASTRSEVQTKAAVEAGLKAGKRVCLPARRTEEHEMEAFAIRSWNELVVGDLGFLEPAKRRQGKVEPGDIKLVIVPGVAFDKTGNRLGRGLHYYDTFLKDVHAPVVALAFEMQIVPKVPIDDNDIAVDRIVTEKRVIECKEGK